MALLPARTLRYRSIHQMNQAVIRWSRELDPTIDLVVGVPRSGMLPATMLALHTHKRLMTLSEYLGGVQAWSGSRKTSAGPYRNVLIVDDSANSGTEMSRVRQAVEAAGLSERVQYAAVYASPEGTKHVDTYAEELLLPRLFEWNIMNHEAFLSKTCMDIDGVLCADPTSVENDDGQNYRAFMSDTELRYRPAFKVRSLVTSRLEKYRPETEAWLAKHGIEYGELIMLDLPSAAERSRLAAHASHKAAYYAASDAELFIESAEHEGRRIFEETGKPVFVTDTREFFGPGSDPEFREPLRRGIVDRLRQKLGI